MTKHDFYAYHKAAEQCKIVESDLFNTAGYFWINLTLKQHRVMYDLLIAQGAVEVDGGVSLRNGLRVNRI